MAQAGWWTPHVNLTFVESTDNDAEIRVSFDPSDGAWSYIGTDCRSIPADQPTMNLGFEDGGTAAHEFGHAIGLGHEHQNPQGGIEWNEPEVIRDLSGRPIRGPWTRSATTCSTSTRWTSSAPRRSIRSRSCSTSSLPGGPRTASAPRRTTCFPRTKGVGGDDVSEIAAAVGHAADRGRHADGGEHRHAGEEDQFVFAVTEAGYLHCRDRGNTDVIMKLFGPDSPTALIAEDDDSGPGSIQGSPGLCLPATISCRSATSAPGPAPAATRSASTGRRLPSQTIDPATEIGLHGGAVMARPAPGTC